MDDELMTRLKRIESKLSQLMLHVGLDPAVRMYDSPPLERKPQVWRFCQSPIMKKPCTTS